MHRSDQTHVAMGGALLAVGAGGVIALVLGAQEGDWCRPGFLALFAFLVLLAGGGSYVLAAVYVPGAWLPRTRAERELAPRLKIYEVSTQFIEEDKLVFLIGLTNEGRGRITGAVVNVLVPKYLQRIERCDQEGQPLGEGRQASTPESVEDDEKGDPVPSIYWIGIVDFPGRTARPHYFRTHVPQSGVLRIKLDVTAEELDTPFVDYFSLPLSDEALRPH